MSALRSSMSSKPDVDAEQVALGVPRHRGADAARVNRQAEALVAAPRIAHAEELEVVDHCGHRLARRRLQQHREQAARAGEVALAQIAWSGCWAGQGAAPAAPSAAPRASARARAPAAWCSFIRIASVRSPRAARKASSGEAQMPEQPVRPLEPRPVLLVGRDRAEHRVGVADEHLGAGMDDDVGAELQRLVEERASPRNCRR